MLPNTSNQVNVILHNVSMLRFDVLQHIIKAHLNETNRLKKLALLKQTN